MILRLVKNEGGIFATYIIAERGKMFSLYATIKEMVPDFEFKNYTVEGSSVAEVIFEKVPRKVCTIALKKVRRTS